MFCFKMLGYLIFIAGCFLLGLFLAGTSAATVALSALIIAVGSFIGFWLFVAGIIEVLIMALCGGYDQNKT